MTRALTLLLLAAPAYAAGREKGAAPLRQIVETIIPAADAYSRQKVRLVCGHEIWCSGSAIYRARCRKCRDEAPE